MKSIFRRKKIGLCVFLFLLPVVFLTGCGGEKESDKMDTITLEEGKFYEEKDVEIDGRKYSYVKYCMNSGKIRIVRMKTEEEELLIPAQLHGYPVGSLGVNVLDEKEYAALEADPEFEYEKREIYSWMKNEKQKFKKITFSEGIEEIKMDSFSHIRAEQIEIPATVKEVGMWGFLDSDIEHVIVKGKETTLGSGCFANSKLKSIELPEDFCGEIGDECFENTEIETFQWPSYEGKDWDWIYEHVNDELFLNCKKLKKITITPKTKKILFPQRAFYGCSLLKEIEIPKHVENVDYYSMPYAENYKKGVNTLIFKGKKTEIRTITDFHVEKDYITVSKIIAPKNSKAIQFAKKAKRVKYISPKIKRGIRLHSRGIEEYFVQLEEKEKKQKDYIMEPVEYEEAG